MHWLAPFGDWLYWFFGLSGTGPMYALWSGPAADATEVTLIGGLAAIYRRHTCHTRWCWRWAKHKAGPYMACRKHHPAIPDRAPTAADIAAAHRAAEDVPCPAPRPADPAA